MSWACECHGRPYVHRAVVLPFSQPDYRWAWEQAEKTARTYERSGASDYTPDPKWTHRGPLAERVFAHHLNLWHTPYRDVGESRVDAPSDVEFGVEMRAIGHWRLDRQNEFCISLMPKDRQKLNSRSVWVLASIKYEASSILYWGYRKGSSIPLADEPFDWQTKFGKPKRRIALVYPDQLAPAEALESWLERRVDGRVSWKCGCPV